MERIAVVNVLLLCWLNVLLVLASCTALNDSVYATPRVESDNNVPFHNLLTTLPNFLELPHGSKESCNTGIL